MPKRIIVLGTMRSGTSLTADLVRRWGAYHGGDDNLWKSDIQDPRGYGYMEYIPLQELNDALLDHNDRVPPLRAVMESRVQDPELRHKARNLLEKMDEQAVTNRFDAWIWKDARLPLTIPFWERLWGDPIYVVTIRHPAEVALSSARTEEIDESQLPFSAGLTYWQYCMLNILSFTQHSDKKIFMSYEQLLNEPEYECTRLSRFLDKHSEKPSADAQRRIEAMLPQVMRSQRHHHYEKSLAEMEQATREQRALYNFLRVKVMYPDEAFREEDFALYPGWQEYLQAMDMVLTLSQSDKHG
ncbi:MAG TPA: sulfotransferase [Anaerolineales bacterium]|nr:sulfotransferase [Anaerolineales bacterium]